MELHVFLAVLLAAAMHAGWNAVVKGGGDPFTTVTHVTLFSGAAGLVWLPLLEAPKPNVWIWLLASAAIHTVYRLMMIGAYRSGDMAQVYPIMRGTPPLVTAIATALLIGEVIGPAGFAAVTALSLGVVAMSLKGGQLGRFNRRAVGFALASALSTVGYTLADGIGARTHGAAFGYVCWMTVGNSVAMQVTALAMRGPSIYASLPGNWKLAAGGGLMSLMSYAIAIWAMTQAPIALVAALRESSVLFGALIATLILKEPLTGWRIAASALVVAGVVLLRIA